MQRTLATHLAVLAVGMSLGLGAVAIAQDRPRAVASAAPADSRIVRELRTTNQRLQGIGAALFLLGSKVDRINQNLTGFSNVSPIGRSIRDILRTICVNTGTSTTYSFCN